MASQKIRRIFFWFLVLLFISTVPAIIFYTRGYRFSFERGIFVYTGSITIKSNPSQINVALNQKPVESKKTNFLNNSYHIDGIRPGEYLLEISAPGYKAWSKNIAIHSGVSTEFWNVVLTKNEYPVTSFYTSSHERFFFSPDNKYFSFAQTADDELKINVFNIDNSTTDNIFSSKDYQFTDNEKENIEWSRNSKKVIIPVLQEGKKHFFIVDINEKIAVDLKDLAHNENLERARWDTSKNTFVYYISEKNLYRLDIGNPAEKRQIASNISAFDISGNDIYYIQLSSGIIYKTNIDGTSASQITASSLPETNRENYRLIAYDDKRIIVLDDDSHKLFVWNEGDKEKYFRELSGNASGAQFSDDGKKILFWNDGEIFVYFTRDWEVQPYRSENEIFDITRFSQKIQNVQWAKDYEHIILSADKKIKVVELDHRDRRNIMDIIPLVSESAKIVLNFSDNKLYFSDKKEGDANFNVYSIDFPEKTGLLGG